MFNSIYFNGNEYKEMWLNGNKIWEKDNGGGEEIVYPYADADSVITYRNLNTSSQSKTFTVIDRSLPYSINGVSGVKSYTFPYGETKVKLVNLMPSSNMCTTTFFATNYEQLRVKNTTDISNLFKSFCYDSSYTYSWSPQYFEFNRVVTDLDYLFASCKYLTDDMMAQFMPHFETFNTSAVTTMNYFLSYNQKVRTMDLSHFDTSNVTNMNYLFYNTSGLKELHLESWNTSKVTSYEQMFRGVYNCTIYIGDGWTLGTDSDLGWGENLTFVRNGEVVEDEEVYGDINVSTTDLYVTEETTSSSLGVKLSQSPTNPQTVTYTYTSDRVATWSNTFTFDSTNWNTYQYVAFTPDLDGLYTDRTDTITFTSDGVENVSVSVFVTNTEQENTGGDTGGEQDYSIITYKNTSTSAVTKYFDIIDNTQPYSINGVNTDTFSFPASSETRVELINLKPARTGSTFLPVNFEKLYLPNLTDLSYLFSYYKYSSSHDWAWSPQNFTFSDDTTTMARMFYFGGLQDSDVSEIMPCIPNTSHVTSMTYMFYYNNAITTLDLSDWDVSNVTDIARMFYQCKKLTKLDLSSWNTSKVTSYSYMFSGVSNCTIYIGDGWTLGTEPTFAGGKGLTFVKGSSGEDSGDSGATTNSLLVDWTQSTAPTLPSYMTEYFSNTYGWTHGTFTTGVYGLISNNFSMDGTTAYTCYKYVAPKSGYLNITYRCYAETNYDYMTVHVNTSTSQPSTTNATNRIFTTQKVSSYQNTDGIATVQVTGGTTYYIHIQYRKDSSGMEGADRGCIRKIELVE